MPTPSSPCQYREVALGRTLRALRLENDLIATTILLDKGADIYELIYKPRAMDVLWKSPWGLKAPGRGVHTAATSQVAWLEHYPGGWQEILPNGGSPCTYKGVELNFHGESSTTAWEYEVVQADDDVIEVRLHTRLFRTPFRMIRHMRLEAGQPYLTLVERVTNEGGEAIDFMWGHHPAFGAPFLSEAVRVDLGARAFQAEADYDHPHNPLQPGALYPWPQGHRAGRHTDISQVPSSKAPRSMMAYLTDFESGWYGLTNTELGFGVGLVWPTAIFPYAWFWQEMHANGGFPWYKNAYVMAIEPWTSFPGAGLLNVMEKTGTHRTLQPGESLEAELKAVFYESTTGIERIDSTGGVHVRSGSMASD